VVQVNKVAEKVEREAEAAKSAAPYVIGAVLAIVAASTLLAWVSSLKAGFVKNNGQYVEAAIILSLGLVAVELLAKGVEIFFAAAGPGVAKLVRTIVRIVGYAVLLSLLASVFNASTAAAVTLGSFAGMAVGFASQQVVGNALAGLFLAVSRPFGIGDKVSIPGLKAEGVVADIGVMYTVLETGDKRVLVPSSKILGNVIEVSKQKYSGQKESNT
jgi:small conductance mechanosensitive channel